MGDMNDNPDNQSIKQILQAKSRVRNITTNDLFAPFAKVEGGSSVYDKRWNRYDNIIVSANMLGRERIHLRQIDNKHMGATFTLPFMLNDNGHPLPTYKGTEYIGGVSDHLPIYIILEVE
jgi:endonuclease/exonuclease/phosphatase family metal-dependent hydrolase